LVSEDDLLPRSKMKPQNYVPTDARDRGVASSRLSTQKAA